ncbi:unnamed protein product [Blepharisma stoltei]|uniref:PH domain-containing protein n=1 Tax=Blepharisma stoltei TaxID=1481888 RepID=A0AAU9JU54_9CILI|nr:unnamed protein product [Blepharisma stoltei]
MDRDNIENFEVILREGWIEKQSRFVKEWRRRWLVLTPKFLFTFKQQHAYRDKPTETLRLQACLACKSAVEETKKDFSFKVETKERIFYFSALDRNDKDGWIGAIARAMVRPEVLRTLSEENALNGVKA